MNRFTLVASACLLACPAAAQQTIQSIAGPSLSYNAATDKLDVAPGTPTQIGGYTVSTGLQANSGALSVMYGTAAGTAAQGNDPRIALGATAVQPAAMTTAIAQQVTAALGSTLSLGGGTLVGPLILSRNPGSPMEAATKSYVDSSVAAVSVGTGAINYTAAAPLAVSGANITISLGTGPGTVAAGNDPRITGALQSNSNLSDLASASLARSNLGLNTAALQPASAFDTAGAAATEQTRAQTAEATLAPLVSPNLSGTPTAPTATAGASSGQIATTAFATSAVQTARNATIPSAAVSAPLCGTGAPGAAQACSPTAYVASVAGYVGAPTATQLNAALIGTTAGTARDAGAAIAAETAAQNTAAGAQTLAAAAATPAAVSTAVAAEATRAETAEGGAAQKANNLSDLPSPATARANLQLGSAALQPSTAFDASGAASSATLTETNRAEAAEALASQKAANLSDLTNTATARANLQLGTAALAASSSFDPAGAATMAATAETNRAEGVEATLVPKTPGDTTHLILGNGTSVGLGNITVSSGALVAPTSGGGTSYGASGNGLALNGGVFSLVFPNGVTPPATLPKVAATGGYGDLTGLPALGSAAAQASTAFDPAGAATSAVQGLAPLASPVFTGSPTVPGYATTSQVASLAPLVSPALTGTPTAPTPTAGDSTTKVATTGFVTPAISAAVSGLAPLASPSFTGSPVVPGYATTAQVSVLAPLASPAMTGTPTAPTPASGDSTTKLATTGFVTPAIAAETTRATTAEGAAAQKANNLADLASAATARTNLGLGTAATAAIGTAAGTVAAGNDSRIVGALQTSAAGPLATQAGANESASIVCGLGVTPIPASGAPVQTVAGRTGAITLSTSDISGLGSAATQATSAFDAAGAATTARTASLPSATAGLLYGSTGAAGTATAITPGSGLSLSGGVLTAAGGSPATTTTAGLVKVPAASGLSVAGDGTLSNTSLLATSQLGAASGVAALDAAAKLPLSTLDPSSCTSGYVVSSTGTGFTCVAQTGGGNVSTDSAGTISSQKAAPSGALAQRTLGQRASDTFNWKDFGASGSGSAATVGTAYGTTPAAWASYTAPDGSHSLAWANNPTYGLQFTMSSALATPAGSGLFFMSGRHSCNTGGPCWNGLLALWTDPANHNMLVAPGMQVTQTSGTSCLAANTVIAPNTGSNPLAWGIAAIPVRQQELLPASGSFPAEADYRTGTYATGARVAWNGGHWTATTGGTTGSSVGVLNGFPSSVLNGGALEVSANGTTLTVGTFPGYSAADQPSVFSNLTMPFNVTFWSQSTGVIGTGTVTAYQGGYNFTLSSAAPTLPAGSLAIVQGGGVYTGGPTYGGSFGLPWETGTNGAPNNYPGTTFTDGTITWTLEGREDVKMLPTGTINLSPQPTGPCPANATFQFTESPAQLEALTQDYVAAQTATYLASLVTQGGVSFAPAGQYMLNHPVIVPSVVTNTNTYGGAIAFAGAGQYQTSIDYLTDPGWDACAVQESNMGSDGQFAAATYRDFSMLDLQQGFFAVAQGTRTVNGKGLCVGKGSSGERFAVQGFATGLSLQKDHNHFEKIGLGQNACDMDMGDYNDTVGNQIWQNSTILGGQVASFCLSPSGAIDSSTISEVHTGFAPYSVFALPNQPNISVNFPELIGGTNIINMWMEAVGQEVVHAPNRDFGTITMVRGGVPAVGNGYFAIPNVGVTNTPATPALAVIYARNFTNSTLIGTDLGAAFSGVTQALIYTPNGSCDANTFRDDPQMVVGNGGGSLPTQAVPALKCGVTSGFGNESTYEYPNAAGTFAAVADVYVPGSGWQSAFSYAGMPVQSPHNSGATALDAAVDGSSTFGFAAAACANDGITRCPIQTSGVVSNAVNFTAGTINVGQPVFATAFGGSFGLWAGITGGVSSAGEDGFAITSCAAGQTCQIRIGGGGSPGADVGLTGGAAIAHGLATFTTVASGASSPLPVEIALGQCVRTVNAGANALTLTAPSGWTLGSSATVPAASGGLNGGATHCRNGATSYD